MTTEAANATVVRREEVADCLFRMWVRPDEPVARWEPGQFVRLAVPGEDVEIKKQARAFSIVGIADGNVEFYGVEVAGGALSPKLRAAAVGDRIWLESKVQGQFTLANNPAGTEVWMFASGVGLAPFMAWLRHGDLSRYSAVVVVHQVRRSAHLAYADEIAALCRADAKFRYVPVVSGDERFPYRAGHAALKGHIGGTIGAERLEQATGLTLSPGVSVIMLCGNPAMIQGVRERLEAERGLKKHMKRTPGHVVTERYW
jgi:ferredoxin--NADP+ reductase